MLIQGKKYTNIRTPLNMRDRIMAEPLFNPDNETDFFDAADIFPEINQEKIRFESEANQKGISLKSETNQKRIRKIAIGSEKIAGEKMKTNEKPAKKVSKASLEALPKARGSVAQNPLTVMQDNWELVQWLDEVFGMEKLEKMKSFPRRLARRANAHFELKKPRTTTFYKGIVRYYSNYKRSIPLPMWWLRLEFLLEKTVFKLLQD